jgi:phosphoglycerate kinase
VGGSKVSSKIGVIESLLEKVDILLLGGGMIFTFYKAQGISVGSSLVEEDKLDLATTLIKKAKAKGVSLLLPTDVVIADKFAPDANSKVCFLSSPCKACSSFFIRDKYILAPKLPPFLRMAPQTTKA